MTRQVIVVGNGDFARILSVYLQMDTDWNVAGFAVHRRFLLEPRLLDLPVFPLETLATTHPPEKYELLVAIGYSRVNQGRVEVFNEVRRLGYRCVSYINSRATHCGNVHLGENVVVLENNVLQPFVTLGDNVVLWSGNFIGHDTVIRDHCFVAVGAVISGRVTIHERTVIGSNATIRDGITVHERCIIGAGALILEDTAPGQVYKGRTAELLGIPSEQLRRI